jgi:hypothetical protein
LIRFFKFSFDDSKKIYRLSFSFRHPFKPYQKNKDFDDDEDEFVDILDDDVEDEVVDVEQELVHIELDDNEQSNENNNVIMSSNIDISSPVLPTAFLDEDEFISDDEESNASPDLPVSIDELNKEILELLYKTYSLALRTRKLVKIMRNISAIDQYTRNHPNGPANGFVVDMRVSSTLFISKV